MKPAQNLTLDIYFYGELAMHIGMNQLEFAIYHSKSVSEIKNCMAQEFATWHSFVRPIYNVVNRELVNDDVLVHAGDVLAFFDEKPII